MTKIDFEWLCAWALVFKKKLKPLTVARLSSLPFPKEMVMKRCKLGHSYRDVCVDCRYRNGGRLSEAQERHEDTLSGFSRLMSRGEMEDALNWMRGYQNPNKRFR